MEFVQNLYTELLTHTQKVIAYPMSPGQRIFYLYLISSFLFAIGAYVTSSVFKEDRSEGRKFLPGLLHFVFPNSVWGHPSAWVDVRYFLPHQIIRLWIHTDIVVMFYTVGLNSTLFSFRSASGLDSVYVLPKDHTLLVVAFALVSPMILDFLAFLTHYFQHKVPALWEFHKIHHSAEVLHPLSNYREHPVDNISYATTLGLGSGFVVGVFQFLFGVTPIKLLVPVLGITIVAFTFNFFAYNLRHSHIWVRWPGVFAYILGCPAHHQIHHSCKQHHINKNFAFYFPIWDVLFGTFYLPKEKEEMVFGIGDGTEKQYNSFLRIYALPFINMFKTSASQR